MIMGQVQGIGKKWADMLDLLEFYLLTYHRHSLTKNNFLKQHFMEEARDILLGQVEKQVGDDQISEKDFRKQLSLAKNQLLIKKKSKQFERRIIYEVFHLYSGQYGDELLQQLSEEFVKPRLERLNLQIQMEDPKLALQQQGSLAKSQKMYFDKALYNKLRWVKIKDLRDLYHNRVYRVYQDEYGLNGLRLMSYLLQAILYLLSYFRIFLHMLVFLVFPTKDSTEYIMQKDTIHYIVLTAILVNFFLYEFMKSNVIGVAVNRTKQKNALVRLQQNFIFNHNNRTNMISWHRDYNYFMPKEVPTMNMFCKVSWTSWNNARRVVLSLFQTEKNIIDTAYTFIGLYVSFVLLFAVFDYYGTVWEKNLFFDNSVLTYLMGIDIVIITFDIGQNLFQGCDINQLSTIQIQSIKNFSIFLAYLENHLEYLYDDEVNDVHSDEEDHLIQNLSESKLRCRQAIAQIKRQIILRRTFEFANDKTMEMSEIEDKISETPSLEDISGFLGELCGMVGSISEQLEYEAETLQEVFLGFVPVTYEYISAVALTILPLIGGIIWQYITKETDG